MKKVFAKLTGIIILAGLLVACANPVSQNNVDGNSGSGEIRVAFAQERTISSGIYSDITDWRLTVSRNGVPSIEKNISANGGEPLSVSVPAGTWNLRVEGFNRGWLLQNAVVTNINIVSSQSKTVPVSLSIPTDSGDMELYVFWTAEKGGENPSLSATLKNKSGTNAENLKVEMASLTGATSAIISSSALVAGDYRLELELKNGSAVVSKSVDAVIIDPVKGLVGNYNLLEGSFIPTEVLGPRVSINTRGGFHTTYPVTTSVTMRSQAGSAVIAQEYKLNDGSWTPLSGNTISITEPSTLSLRATNSLGTTSIGPYTFVGEDPDQGNPPTDINAFYWDNASVYFVITDRFLDGNPSNNNSYGRVQKDAWNKNIGTFHGGDIAGLTARLNDGYFTDLGINAIWLTAPYEQAHGWVGGGSGDFAHYAYHGYYALDFSNIDANMGTKEEFATFVKTAHQKGVRVILDVVMNHTGYATLADMRDFDFKPVHQATDSTWNWTPGNGQHWSSYHDILVNYKDAAQWGKWWGSNWVRCELPGYSKGSGGDLELSLAGLPDFKTNSTNSVGLPHFLTQKSTFGGAFSQYNVAAARNEQKRVRDWLSEWLSQWVKEYGIDGFRVDTAKHVEMDSWNHLRGKVNASLDAWRIAEAAKPEGQRDPAYAWSDPFWMTAEVWGHGPNQSNYHTPGAFDSVINFSFQGEIGGMLGNAGSLKNKWGSYAGNINNNSNWNASKNRRNWNALSYISSHDTGSVFFNGDNSRQQKAGTALLLLPGAVQIFYGDELGRVNGDNGSDKDQGSRSSMDWNRRDNEIHQHWKKVGSFRRDNPAVGAGSQSDLPSSSGTAMAREFKVNGTTVNKVAIVAGASGTASITVSNLWENGTKLRNAYTGVTATVSGGSVSFAPGNVDGLILIEQVR